MVAQLIAFLDPVLFDIHNCFGHTHHPEGDALALLSLSKATLSLGPKTLFRDLDLSINRGDRIGLIGPNGCGKSSLLKVLSNLAELDSGKVGLQRNISVGHLSQDLTDYQSHSLTEFVLASVPGREQLATRIGQVEIELERSTESPVGQDPEQHDAELMRLSAEIAELNSELTDFETVYGQHVALRTLSGLGFQDSDFSRPLREFSGGWQIRAIMAGLLFRRPEIMLLDEPTNHLDMPSVGWFAAFLKKYRGAFILVSHDSEFMDEQVNRIVSFEPEGVRTYRGNWKSYRKQRLEEREHLQNRALRQQRGREKAESFITRFRAQANKAKAVQSRVKALEKMDAVELHQEHNSIHFTFPPTERVSKTVLRVKNLHKSFGNHHVLKGISTTVSRGQKVAIVGPNGAGKTTLLSILANEQQSDSGEISFGQHVKTGYYAQQHAETLRPAASILEEVGLRAGGQSGPLIRGVLGSLLFSGQDVEKKVGILSGGEKARVALGGMLVSRANVLLMDEPTNHLDIVASERLADSLALFDGTIIFVSHNRGFVRKLATDIWAVEDGKLEIYPGTLDDYLARSSDEINSSPPPSLAETIKPMSIKVSAKERRRREAERRQILRKKISPLQKSMGRIEEEISLLETDQAELETALSAPSSYIGKMDMADVSRKYESNRKKLSSLNEKWEELGLQIEALESEEN